MSEVLSSKELKGGLTRVIARLQAQMDRRPIHYRCARLAREVMTVVFHTSVGLFRALVTRCPATTFPVRLMAIDALFDCISF